MSFKSKITHYINSGYPVLLVQTSEERRVATTLFDIVQKNKADAHVWSWTMTEGWTCQNEGVMEHKDIKLPKDALRAILDDRMAEDSLMVIYGFELFLPNPEIVQLTKDLVQYCKTTGRTVIFVSHNNPIPSALSSHITMVDFDLPTEKDLSTGLKGILEDNNKKISKEIFNQAVESALGMTEFEAENAFALSLVMEHTINPAIIRREKAQVIKKSGLLEYYEPNSQMNDIGGLNLLKAWVKRTGIAFTRSADAKEYGLPPLSGIINVGPAGCGKSLTAKAIANDFNISLLRFDVSKLFGSLVGASEQNTRDTLKLAEAMSPCVLWIDEIEKALAGASSSGATDSGVTARVLGILLTWMQEKTKPVFIVATANDVTGLRPELLSRFDEIFAIDLPNEAERMEIASIHIAKRKRDPAKFNLKRLVARSKGFSGREIEQSIISGMYEAFADKKEVATEHILKAMKETRPLIETMPKQIKAIQEWSKTHARPATSSSSATKTKVPERKINIDELNIDVGAGGVS